MFVVGTAENRPKAALVNQQSARRNIETKISILERWVKDGVPYAYEESGKIIKLPGEANQMDYYPNSVRQFNFWERSKQCSAVAETLPDFSRNANDTLRRHPGYRKQVESLIGQVATRASQQAKKERVPALAELRRQLRVAETRNGVLEDGLVDLRSLVRKLEEKVKRMHGQAEMDLGETAKIRSKLETEIAELRRQNADLAKSLINIKSIRKL